MSEKGIPSAAIPKNVFADPETTGRLATEAGLTIDPEDPGMATGPDGKRAYWDNVNWRWCDLETDAPLSSSGLPASHFAEQP